MRSFSGVHEFGPDILLDTDADPDQADEIVWNVEHGFCPRCEGKLPKPPEYPAGSRITRCRSIPICGRCGGDEALEGEYEGAISAASCWPLRSENITAREEQAARDSEVVTGILLDDSIITTSGVSPIRLREHPGGWAEFGSPQEGL